MSKVNVQPGTYKAKINNYFIDQTSSGHPRVNIKFNVQTDPKHPNTTQVLSWNGSMASEKSRDLVLKTLETCGLKNRAMFSAITRQKEGGALDLNREVYVEVITEMKEPRDGSAPYEWTSIKYVNPLDGIVAKDLMSYEDFDAYLNNTGLGQEFEKRQQVKGEAQAEQPQAQSFEERDASNQQPVSFDNIPF